MNTVEEVNLAWALLDSVSPRLSKKSRTRLYAQLGAGECGNTIRQILEMRCLDGAVVPAELVDRLWDWVAGYERTESAATLRELIDPVCTASFRRADAWSRARSGVWRSEI
jgi:hypothetical protein